MKELLEQIAKEQSERLNSIDVSLAEIKKDLNYHIMRTDLLESEFKPVKKHVETVNILAKVFSALVTAAAGLAGLVKYFL